jgi:uncharacterized protein YqeY
MPIFDQVNAQMKDALRGQRKLELQALRSIRAAFLVRMKEDASETVTDADCLPILRKLEKQRHESIEAFENAGRAEQAAAEKAKLESSSRSCPASRTKRPPARGCKPRSPSRGRSPRRTSAA